VPVTVLSSRLVERLDDPSCLEAFLREQRWRGVAETMRHWLPSRAVNLSPGCHDARSVTNTVGSAGSPFASINRKSADIGLPQWEAARDVGGHGRRPSMAVDTCIAGLQARPMPSESREDFERRLLAIVRDQMEAMDEDFPDGWGSLTL
jgi:hypothetical protein